MEWRCWGWGWGYVPWGTIAAFEGSILRGGTWGDSLSRDLWALPAALGLEGRMMGMADGRWVVIETWLRQMGKEKSQDRAAAAFGRLCWHSTENCLVEMLVAAGSAEGADVPVPLRVLGANSSPLPHKECAPAEGRVEP